MAEISAALIEIQKLHFQRSSYQSRYPPRKRALLYLTYISFQLTIVYLYLCLRSKGRPLALTTTLRMPPGLRSLISKNLAMVIPLRWLCVRKGEQTYRVLLRSTSYLEKTHWSPKNATEVISWTEQPCNLGRRNYHRFQSYIFLSLLFSVEQCYLSDYPALQNRGRYFIPYMKLSNVITLKLQHYLIFPSFWIRKRVIIIFDKTRLTRFSLVMVFDNVSWSF